MQVVPDGRRCECGNRGCWEQYASGNVLVREARELAAADSPVAHRLLELAGGDAAAITGPLITEAARDGDPAARELFEEVGHWLGVGIANLAAALDPGTFVIGGGLSEAGDLLLAPARDAFAQADRPRLPARGDHRAGDARQRGRPGRRGRPGPAVRPALPPGQGAGARPPGAARRAGGAVTAPQRLSNVDAAWLGIDSPDNLMMVTAVLDLDDLSTGSGSRGRRAADGAALPAPRDARVSVGFAVRAAGVDRRPRLHDGPPPGRRRHGRRRARAAAARQPAARHTPRHEPAAVAAAAGAGRVAGVPPTGSVVVARLHHCIADGIALAQVLLSLTDDGPTCRTGRGPPAARRAGRAPPPRTAPAAGHRVGRDRAGDGRRRAGRAVVAAGRCRRTPRLAGALTGTGLLLANRDPRTRLRGRLGTAKGGRVVGAAGPPPGEAGGGRARCRPSTT